MNFEIDIDKAINALAKNIADHIKELEAAREVWVADMHTALNEFKAAVDRKGLDASHEALHLLLYKRPVDNRPQYSKHLGALQAAKDSGQTKIVMDEDEYDRVFNDNWDWRNASKVSNQTYSSRRH